MSRHRRALGYARVSSAEQALGTSLRDQQEAIEREAKARGIEELIFFVEAESAGHEKIERREQIRALLGDVRNGDLVLVDKLDRWSRDIEFTHGSVRRIREAGASFYAVAERLDPSTRDGELAFGIRAVLAREEHQRIRVRTVGTRALLRDQGYYVEGPPPLGYKRQLPKGARGLEKNILIPVPEEADLVRRIFKMYVDGWSMTALARELDLKLDRVKDVLHRRVYIGEIRSTKGEWIKARHEALVSPDLFARAQTIIRERTLGGPRPRAAPSRTSSWLLRDVARCGHCEAKMSAAYAKTRRGDYRFYYRCSKHCRARGAGVTTQAHVRVDAVEPIFGHMMLLHLEELREELANGEEPERAPVQFDFARRRVKLANRRARFHEMYADEQMTRTELRGALARLDAEVLRLDAEEAAAERAARAQSPAVRRAALRDLRELKARWKGANVADKRLIIGELVHSVGLVAPDLVTPRWRPLAELLSEIVV